MKKYVPLLAAVACLALASCSKSRASTDDAKQFLAETEDRLLALNIEGQRADWLHENFITDDTEALSAKADQRAIDETVKHAKESTRFDGLGLPEDQARK